MKALGNFLLRTRAHAAFTISALTVLSLLVSPLSYFISGAPMALVALRKGWFIGCQVAVGSLLLLALPTMAMNLQPGVPLAFMLSVWLPVILCAGILRATRSQGLTLLFAGTLGIFSVAVIYALLGDIQKWWRESFENLEQYARSDLGLQQLEQIYQLTSPMLSAVLASGFVISLITTLLLARWWQSTLFNPGGFKKEFYALRLPRFLVVPTLLGLLALLLAHDFILMAIRDFVIIMLILYLYQGVSVVHGYIYTRGLRSKIWLIGMYSGFFLLPHAILLFVCGIGLVNACLGREPVQVTDNNP